MKLLMQEISIEEAKGMIFKGAFFGDNQHILLTFGGQTGFQYFTVLEVEDDWFDEVREVSQGNFTALDYRAKVLVELGIVSQEELTANKEMIEQEREMVTKKRRRREYELLKKEFE